jgi:hypothetical protein
VVGAAGLALALATAGPAAAQTPLRVPAVTGWGDLPDVALEGAPVVVKTLDGRTVKGRLSSLSDTAIVLDGGRVRTIPAASVVSIEGGRMPRPVKRGARIGFRVGMFLSACSWAAAAEYAADPASCAPDECVRWSDALFGTLFFPAVGAGIGAGIGALIPGKRTLLYAAPGSSPVALAPIAGHGRRGVAVRVAF